MQTEQQRLRIFRYGRYAFFCLSVILTATFCHAQMMEVVINPPDTQQLLDREKSLVAEPADATGPSLLLLEHEQILLADALEKTCIPAEKEIIEAPPLAPSINACNTFVYPPQRKFLPNPLTGEKISLSSLPYQLTPFGTPPRKKHGITNKSLIIKPSKPTAEEIAKKEAEEKEALKQQSEMTAMSPFLAWIKENKEKAVETAQNAVQKYKKEPPIKTSDDDNDLFLSIRFPYKGAEPAGNSVAIYSTPEK